MHSSGRWRVLAWRIIRHPLWRYLACWAALLCFGGKSTYEAWTCYDIQPTSPTSDTSDTDSGKSDTSLLLIQTSATNNDKFRGDWFGGGITTGPNSVDFGGQWFTGKMILRGEGRFLYERRHQSIVFHEYWPEKEAGLLMWWLMGPDEAGYAELCKQRLLPMTSQDPFATAALAVVVQENSRCVGGQLYPPIHAFLYVPLALLKPADAYKVAVLIPVPLAFLAGWGLRLVSRGGIWWPVGALLTMIFPHFIDAQTLGHNGALIVALMVWGYYFLQKGDDIRGGIVWGFIAYKPSWAFMYFVLLLVTRRWKAAAAMGTCAVVQILLTIPFVGVQSWLEWRQVVARAAPAYGVYENWVKVSRDMFTFPRRALTDWKAPEKERDLFEARLIGYVLIGLVLEITVRLTALRGQRSKRWSYAAGAFLLLGFWMSGFHITYYDTIFATLPLALLLLVPNHLFTPFLFRRPDLAWETPLAAGGTPVTLPPRNYGRICNPLIVYLLPLVLWNPDGQGFIDEICNVGVWWANVFGFDVDWGYATFIRPQSSLDLWVNQPLIVLFFAMAWLWAGWMWLREGPIRSSA